MGVRAERILAWTVLAMTAAYAVYFSLYTCILHGLFNTHAYDLGTFDQGIWLAGHERDLFVTVRGLHLLGDHVRLLSFVLAPLYYVWDDVRALLVLQSVVIALGALFLWRIGRRSLPHQPALTGALCASYLLNPAVQNLNLDHAHPDAFASTSILASVHFLRSGRRGWFWLCAALAMSCKEDVPLVYAAMGALVAWRPTAAGFEGATRTGRAFGAILASIALAYFAICVLVILPHFNGVGFFRTAGGGFFSGLGANFEDPAWLARRVLREKTAIYLLALGLPYGFLFLLAPLWLVPALPALAANVLSDAAYPRNLDYHYQTSLVPFLYVATTDALATLQRGAARWKVLVQRSTVLAGLLLACTVAANLLHARVALTRMTVIRTLALALETDPYVHRIQAVLAQVPEHAAVSADYTLVPHLTHRRAIYMFPNPFSTDQWGIRGHDRHDPEVVDYVVRRTSIGTKRHDEALARLTADGTFVRIFGTDEVALYRRTARSTPHPAASCGDWNGDGAVQRVDLKFIANAVLKRSGCERHICDADGNDRMDSRDLHILAARERDPQVRLNCPPEPPAAAPADAGRP